jgi:hypothetical protein
MKGNLDVVANHSTNQCWQLLNQVVRSWMLDRERAQEKETESPTHLLSKKGKEREQKE